MRRFSLALHCASAGILGPLPIHMGMVVGRCGISIRIRPLRGEKSSQQGTEWEHQNKFHGYRRSGRRMIAVNRKKETHIPHLKLNAAIVRSPSVDRPCTCRSGILYPPRKGESIYKRAIASEYQNEDTTNRAHERGKNAPTRPLLCRSVKGGLVYALAGK